MSPEEKELDNIRLRIMDLDNQIKELIRMERRLEDRIFNELVEKLK